MRQRVMIAMALALEPADRDHGRAHDRARRGDPAGDPGGAHRRCATGSGFAVLFITHDLSLLVEIADSIAVMYAGRLVERAGASALFRAPRHPYTLGLLSSFPPLHGPRRAMAGIPGSPPDLRNDAVRVRLPPALRVRVRPVPHRPAAVAATWSAGPGRPRAGCRTAAGPCPPSWPAPVPAGAAAGQPERAGAVSIVTAGRPRAAVDRRGPSPPQRRGAPPVLEARDLTKHFPVHARRRRAAGGRARGRRRDARAAAGRQSPPWSARAAPASPPLPGCWPG